MLNNVDDVLVGLPPIRKAFIASPGWQIAVIDYSQLELRVLAHMAQEPVLIRAFHEGVDPHTATGEALGVDRKKGKLVNFAVVYGQGPWALGKSLGIATREAEGMLRNYWKRHPAVSAFRDRQCAQAKRHGYVRSIVGRCMFIDGSSHIGTPRPPWKRHYSRRELDQLRRAKEGEHASRCALNYVIQGSGSDLVKLAMRNLARTWRSADAWGSKARLLLQVHDELVCELRNDYIEEGLRDMQTCCEGVWPGFRVPLEAVPHVGSNWLEAKAG